MEPADLKGVSADVANRKLSFVVFLIQTAVGITMHMVTYISQNNIEDLYPSEGQSHGGLVRGLRACKGTCPKK